MTHPAGSSTENLELAGLDPSANSHLSIVPGAKWANVLTPALVIYPDVVRSNIDATLRQLGGNTSRWRPHLKPAKLESTMRLMVAAGIQQFKCATTLELITACAAGAKDVLVAYPCIGQRAKRVIEISNLY